MIFYPKSYFKSILDIEADFLLKNNIKAVLLDIDNTIIDKESNMVEGLDEWVRRAQASDIKFCILSNTNNKTKAERMSKILDIPFIYFAKKPLKFGFEKAKKIVGVEKSENIAVIGDQVMTDVLGANRCKMYSILVSPVKDTDIWVTKISRVIEKQILKKYFKENNIDVEKKVNVKNIK